MEKRIVEINGVKLEVDLTTARVVESYRVGDNVKVLIKKYGDSFESHPGVIVGFDPFVNRPTIVIAFLETGYNSAEIKFVHLNADTKDCEICPMIEKEFPFDKARVEGMFNRHIGAAEAALAEAKNKKAYFLAEFGSYFKAPEEVAAKS